MKNIKCIFNIIIIFLLIISCSSSNKDNREYKEVISTNSYKITNRIQIARVHFDFNKFNLTRDFIENAILLDLRTNTNILKLYIYGHTDNKGKDWWNYRLGLQRALTVSNIISTNYPAENIILKSFSYSNSIADNRTENGRYSNRRADIFIDLVEETFEIQTNLIKVDSKNEFNILSRFNIDLRILLIIVLVILLLLILLLLLLLAPKISGGLLLSKIGKLIMKFCSGWGNEIINAIGSKAEYKIYRKAGLKEVNIYGRKCLIKPDIDMQQKSIDPFRGEMTNAERIKEGLAPLDKNGKPIQLHHIGQHKNSPLAELTFEEHRKGGNDTILHDKGKQTEVHGDNNQWDAEREKYWKNRYNIMEVK